MHFEIEKISLQNLQSGGLEDFVIDRAPVDEDKKHIFLNFTPPSISISSLGYNGAGINNLAIFDKRYISLSRKVLSEEIRNQDLKLMPGFRLIWYYSGAKIDVDDKYATQTKPFLRNK